MESTQLLPEMRTLPVAESQPHVPKDIDVYSLLIALGGSKKMILQWTFGAALVAFATSFLLPNWYTATTKILPPQQTQSTASMVLSQLTNASSLAALASKDLGLKSPNDIYIGMLRSRTVADALIAKFQLQKVYDKKRISSVRKDLEKNSEISTGKEGLIAISVEDKDPSRAAEIANAYVLELRKVTQNLAITEASQRRLFFEQQLARAKDDLATAEVELKDTQQRTGMIQLDSQAKAVIESVAILRGQIAAKEVQSEAMRSFATAQNPDYVLLQQEIAGLQEQLSKLMKQQPGSGDPFLATSKVPEVALEYVRRLREVKYREAVFELLAKQFEAAKIDEAKQAALIQVLDPAIPPDKRSAPRRGLLVTLAAVFAFLASSAWAMIADSISRVRQNPLRAAKLDALKLSFIGRNGLRMGS